MRWIARCAAALALLAAGAGGANPGEAWAQVVVATTIPLPISARPVPWGVGEYLEYNVKFGPLSAGSGRMQVLPIDTLRGRTAWRLRFDVSGGIPFVRIKDSYDSWLDVETLNSLRFAQDLSEVAYRRKRLFEIFPERGVFSENGKPEQKSVDNPLDDASFFFFLRTIPLVVGETYQFDRYFSPKSNPVIIKALRKDTVRVADEDFAAIVIQPILNSSGIFAEGGHAEIWLSDDNRRILLQMKTRLSVGSLNLYLKKYRDTQPVIPPLGKQR